MEPTKSFDLVKQSIAQNGDALFTCFTKVTHHCSKKNSRPIFRSRATGRPFIGKGQNLKSAEANLINAFRMAMMRQKGFKPIDGPIWAVFLFYFPMAEFFTKKGEISGRLPDQSNLYELVQDTLETAGVIKNDKLIHSHDLSRRLPGPDWGLEVFLFRHTLDINRSPKLSLVKP